MKRQFHNLKPILLIGIPGLLWLGAVLIRPVVIAPSCTKAPQTCTREFVVPFDQLSLGMEDGKADEYSYLTQNLSGAVALIAPLTWNVVALTLKQMNPAFFWSTVAADLSVTLQTVVWNGFLTESSHLISQRPRPFVYSNPVERGIDPSHYTSFYSGHTSFAAASSMALFLILWNRNASLPFLLLSAMFGETMIFSTAYFRILAGRHFLSDVITGALAGLLVAWIVNRKNRLKTPLL